MKVRHIEIEHNGQTLTLDLLVPLSLEQVESVIKKTKEDIAKIRLGYVQYEQQLRKEYSL